MKPTRLNREASGEPLPPQAAGLQPYFFDVPVECPYDLPHRAVYHQALLGRVPEGAMAQFMAAGYRRSGNNLYTMACPQCRECVPIRLHPPEFAPNRNQRRVWKRNQDLVATRGPLQADDEKIGLCNRFLQHRYPGRGNSADEYYFGFFLGTVTEVMEICYRTPDGRLVGVAVVDLGARWLNAVYFFFDPQEGHRSPGTFNILFLIELGRRWQVEHLYLGYWIEEVQAMRYKAAFRPHYLLRDGHWQQQSARTGHSVPFPCPTPTRNQP